MNAMEESRYWLEQAKLQLDKAQSHHEIALDMMEISRRIMEKGVGNEG